MRYFLLIFFLTCFAVVAICGFRGSHSRRPAIELFPDMVRQNKVRPQTPSEFFPDEYASRPDPRRHGAPRRPPPSQRRGAQDQRPAGLSLRRLAGQHRPHCGNDQLGRRSILCPSPGNCSNAASSVFRSIACPATAPTATAKASPANTAWWGWPTSMTND